MRKTSSIQLLCGLLLCASGCRSISSTFVQRMDDDRLVGNSNGNTCLHDNAKPFKGIPVSIPVLTHVDIVISEEIFLDKETLVPVQTNRRNLMAEAKPIKSDKIFAVDPKKAASGQSEYTLLMQEGEGNQFFKRIDQDIADTTIKDINAALGQILPQLLPKPVPTPSTKFGLDSNANQSQADFLPVTRHVAWKRFDVSAPDFQDQIATFVNRHLNDCNSCLESGACAGPNSIQTHEVPVSDGSFVPTQY